MAQWHHSSDKLTVKATRQNTANKSGHYQGPHINSYLDTHSHSHIPHKRCPTRFGHVQVIVHQLRAPSVKGEQLSLAGGHHDAPADMAVCRKCGHVVEGIARHMGHVTSFADTRLLRQRSLVSTASHEGFRSGILA